MYKCKEQLVQITKKILQRSLLYLNIIMQNNDWLDKEIIENRVINKMDDLYLYECLWNDLQYNTIVELWGSSLSWRIVPLPVGGLSTSELLYCALRHPRTA